MTKTASPPVVFGIPLKARGDETEWSIIKSNLNRTLDSLLRQDDQNFIVLISGHDDPEIDRDSRISFVAVEFEKPSTPEAGSRDKTMKRKAAVMAAANLFPAGFYFFILDADDLVDPSVVSFIRSSDNRRGYYLPRGYVRDEAADVVALMSPESGRPFHKSCGSCAVVWFNPEDIPTDEVRSSRFEALRVHGSIPEKFNELGIELEIIPFAAAMYVINNGANLSVLQGKANVQTTHARTHAISDKAEVDRVLIKYGLSGGTETISPGASPFT